MLIRAALMLSIGFVASPKATAGPVDVAGIHRVVTAYYHAIGENRLGDAMSFYHEDSPQADDVRESLELSQSAFLHRTSTLSLTVVHQDDHRTVAEAIHLHRRIAGVKFFEERAETRYELRRYGDKWKIWSSVSRSR